jgi:hypothetical protein
MLLSIACFVHCVAGPVLLSLAGLASLIGVSEKLEPLFLFSSFGTGAATLIPAYRKKHRRRSCLVLFTCGLLILALKRRLPETNALVEAITVAVGALLILGAHLLNLHLSRQCTCCGAGGASRVLPTLPFELQNTCAIGDDGENGDALGERSRERVQDSTGRQHDQNHR